MLRYSSLSQYSVTALGRSSHNTNAPRLDLREVVFPQESGSATRWPVIPPEALEGILQASYSAPSAALRSRLLSLYSALKDLVLVGVANNHTKPTDAVKLLLETASSAAETAGPSGNSVSPPPPLPLVVPEGR